MKAILIATLLVASAFSAALPTAQGGDLVACFNTADTVKISDIIDADQANATCKPVYDYFKTAGTALFDATQWASCKTKITDTTAAASAQGCYDKWTAGMLKADGTTAAWTGFTALVACWETADATFDTGAHSKAACKDINVELLKVATTSNAAAFVAAVDTKAKSCITAVQTDATKKAALEKCNTWYLQDSLKADGTFKTEAEWVNTSIASLKTCVPACTDKTMVATTFTNAACKNFRTFLLDATNKKVADYAAYQTDADACKAVLPTGADGQDCWAKCVTAAKGTAAATTTDTTATATVTTTTTSAQSLVAVALVLLAFLF